MDCTVNMATLWRCLLVSAAALSSAALGQVVICPVRDYEMSTDGQYCYRYVQTRTDYITANRTCVREGGSMVYIQSSEENDRINTNYFVGRGAVEFWIGLNDLETEGTFRWTNLSVATIYTNWMGNTASISNANHLDCVKFTSSSQWVVHNHPCSTSNLPYLCKINTCVQSLIDGDYCAGQEPTAAPQEGVSTEIIVAVVVVVIALTVALVFVLVCGLLWKFNNEAFQRYLCCCVSGKNKSTVHSLQQENERLRKQLTDRKVSVSGRFSHAGELSGVPDGRGGVLPTIKQVPSFSPLSPEGGPLSMSQRGRPPPLVLARPRSQVTPMGRGGGLGTPLHLAPTPMFIGGAPPMRPIRQSAPAGRLAPPTTVVEPILEVKGESDDSSDDEFFKKEEGIADPREAINNKTETQSSEQKTL